MLKRRSRCRKFWKGRSWSWSRIFFLRLCNPAGNPLNLIYTKLMQILRMLLDRPDKKSAIGRPTLQNGHFLYACITPEVHLPYPVKINLSRIRDLCKFVSSQNDESRAQSADFSKACRKPRAFH